MVTNLPERAKAIWAKAVAARDPRLKLQLLEEFYRSFPKHKGTEKLEKSIKRQIASLRRELEEAKRRKGRRDPWAVKKGEEPQLALTGGIEDAVEAFSSLTNLRPSIPSILAKPVVGTFKGLGVSFQLVLAPYDERLGEERRERFLRLMRPSDLILFVGDDASFSKFRDWMLEHNISFGRGVELSRMPSGGIRIVGRTTLKREEIISLLSGYGISNALVRLEESSTLEDVEDAVFGRTFKKVLRLEPGGIEPEELAKRALEELGLIRVFTKKAGSPPSDRPMLLEDGTTVIELAREVHKELAKGFRFAKVWRGGKVVRVGPSFRLLDGDIVEIRSS